MIYHIHNGEWKDVHHLHDLDESVRDCVRVLKDHLDDFDTIATQGMSGAVVASPVSLILKKELSIVRKQGEDCHQLTGSQVISRASIGPGKRVLFLDDFVSTGDTLDRVKKAVEDEGGKISGVFTYHHNEYERWEL